MADQVLATGRRKKAIARVVVKPGNGAFIVNGKEVKDYLCMDTLVVIAKQPLTLTQTAEKYDVKVNVYGGGLSGQAGAIRHGVARALVMTDPSIKAEIKKAGFLTRDSRMVERKKYGLKKARRSPQFSKR